jgi:hypothetical protein
MSKIETKSGLHDASTAYGSQAVFRERSWPLKEGGFGLNRYEAEKISVSLTSLTNTLAQFILGRKSGEKAQQIVSKLFLPVEESYFVDYIYDHLHKDKSKGKRKAPYVVVVRDSRTTRKEERWIEIPEQEVIYLNLPVLTLIGKTPYECIKDTGRFGEREWNLLRKVVRFWIVSNEK